MADTANIAAANTPNTANILARNRREVDTRSAEAGQSSAGVNREKTATGAAEAGVAVTGAAIGIGSPATDSLSADLVIRTGVGTPLGAGAFLTRTRTTAIILRIGTMIAPYQKGDSLGPDRRAIRAYERSHGAPS
jgi:hypothetical protein